MEQKFYICSHCGKVVAAVKETGVPIMCCGQPMQEIVAGTTDASVEKHVPVYNVENNMVNVSIGSIEHPMTNEHFIEWIYLKTNKGYQIKYLNPNEKPQASFILCNNEEVLSIYSYCNLHSLWKI